MSRSWLVRFRAPAAAPVNLVCFPYAGAAAAAYRPWAALLPAAVQLWAAELPGRATRFAEPPLADLAALTDPLTHAIRTEVTGPLVFFGHSMGALLAFEVCRRLVHEGAAPPAHLVVSAKRAPQLPSNAPPITGLPDDDFVRTVAERYGGIPPAVLRERELLQLMLPMLRADLAAVEGYRYRAATPLPLPITALAGGRDPIAPRGDMERWGELTSVRFAVHTVDDGHFFLNSSRAAVLALLSREVLGG